MDIGTFVSLKRYNVALKEVENYHSKIIDKNEEYFYIDFPIHVMTKRTSIFAVDEQVVAEYTEAGVAHEFKTTVLDRVHKNIPALKLKIPEKDDIKRIQRREYVRIETDIDVAIHCPNKSFLPTTSVTEDISGGGAKIYNPPESLKEAQKIDLFLVLPGEDNHFDYIETEAEVVRLHEQGNIKTLSVKFLFDHESKRQKVIQHCFYLQRRNRQSGVL